VGRAVKSLRFRLSGEGAVNLLHVSGVIQIVGHYNPVVLQVEKISRFGHKTQSFHLFLKMSVIEMWLLKNSIFSKTAGIWGIENV